MYKKGIHLAIGIASFLVLLSLSLSGVSAQGTYKCTAQLDPTGSVYICVPMGSGSSYTCDTAGGYDVGNECAMAPQDMTVSACQNRPPFTCIQTNPTGPTPAPVRHQCNSNGTCTPCADPQNQDCTFDTRADCSAICQSGGTHWACGVAGCEPQKNGQYSSQTQCFNNCGAVDRGFDGGCNTKTGKAQKSGDGVQTAIGCIPINVLDRLTSFFLVWLLGIGGGFTFFMFLLAGFKILTSSGEPAKLTEGKSLLTSAVSGLILIIFSIFLLRVIGVNILGLF